jgi:hypothetical protein
MKSSKMAWRKWQQRNDIENVAMKAKNNGISDSNQ